MTKYYESVPPASPKCPGIFMCVSALSRIIAILGKNTKKVLSRLGT